MKKTLITIAVLAMSTGVYAAAGGGKVNNPWQPIDPDTDVCTAFLPKGIDLTDCLELASTTSGITYLCGQLGEYTVQCPVEDVVEEDDYDYGQNLPVDDDDDDRGSSRTDVGNEDRDGDRRGR